MIGCVENNHDHEGLRATYVRGARTPTASRSVTGQPARHRRTPIKFEDPSRNFLGHAHIGVTATVDAHVRLQRDAIDLLSRVLRPLRPHRSSCPVASGFEQGPRVTKIDNCK